MKKPSEKKGQIVEGRSSPVEPKTDIDAIGTVLGDADSSLLSTAKTNWYFGEWEEVAALDIEALGNHPDVAILAALKATGYQQLDDLENCQKYIKVARSLGCDQAIISKLLIAGMHNTLGKIASLKNNTEKVYHHFSASVEIGGKSQHTKLARHARSVKEMARLGLLPQAARLIDKEREALSNRKSINENKTRIKILNNEIKWIKESLTSKVHNVPTDDEDKKGQKRNVAHISSAKSSTQPEKPPFCLNTYQYYLKLSDENVKKAQSFIYLESKSLPRSGLHYLKNTLQTILQESFSFCEWYQEPGCCKRMPCALKGYANNVNENAVKVRLTKSHDFGLLDPSYPVSGTMHRIVMVRDPIYVLTSWYALDCLSFHKQPLSQYGIDMRKITYSHEADVVESAYSFIDQSFQPQTVAELEKWLEKKASYINSFLHKWALPLILEKERNCDLILYREINQFIVRFFEGLVDKLPSEVRGRYHHFLARKDDVFKERTNPFTCRSKVITEYMEENASRFADVIERIVFDSEISKIGLDIKNWQA